MSLYAISDHHFGHQNIIKYCNRTLNLEEAKLLGYDRPIPSEELTALDDAKIMILRHNEIIQDDDLVVFCGDIQASKRGNDWIGGIIPKLKGRKFLVRGNHDHKKDNQYKIMGFEIVSDFIVIDNLAFCHYPDRMDVVDFCRSKGLTLCCGHTHKEFRNYNDNLERINLAVDVQGRYPRLLK